MGVTIELQNLGDAQLCREIVARIQHAFSDRRGEWRVSISGSRASENWEMRVEGPNGFERTYTLVRAAGEHEPEAICGLILRLTSSSWLAVLCLCGQARHKMGTLEPVHLRAREPQMRQVSSANRRLDEHVRRALNKIKKPSTAEGITELLNRDLDPGDRPFQVNEVSIWLRNADEEILSLYWLATRPRR